MKIFQKQTSRKIIYIAISVVLFFGVTFGISKIKAGVGQSGFGWLWGGSNDGAATPLNSGLGWISMNDVNPASGGTVSYGVTIPTKTDCIENEPECKLTGYAWSSTGSNPADGKPTGIGWIDFNPQDNCIAAGYESADKYLSASCIDPDGGYGGVYRSGNSLIGWARIVSIAKATYAGNSGGWDGWIKLNEAGASGTCNGGPKNGLACNADIDCGTQTANCSINAGFVIGYRIGQGNGSSDFRPPSGGSTRYCCGGSRACPANTCDWGNCDNNWQQVPGSSVPADYLLAGEGDAYHPDSGCALGGEPNEWHTWMTYWAPFSCPLAGGSACTGDPASLRGGINKPICTASYSCSAVTIAYGVTINSDPTSPDYNKLSGYAWSNELGWIDFSYASLNVTDTLKICSDCTSSSNSLPALAIMKGSSKNYKACKVLSTETTCSGTDVTSDSTWSVDDSNIATADQAELGKVTGVNEGNTNLTVASGTLPSVTLPVNVTAYAAACNNGIQDAGEACDNGVDNGPCPKTCSNACKKNNCDKNWKEIKIDQ